MGQLGRLVCSQTCGFVGEVLGLLLEPSDAEGWRPEGQALLMRAGLLLKEVMVGVPQRGY